MSSRNCVHGEHCPVPQAAPQWSEDLAIIRKQVEIYLGNGKPGLIPEDLKELRAEVKEHTAYINQQKGSTGTWATVRVVLVPIILSFLTAAVTVWARSR